MTSHAERQATLRDDVQRWSDEFAADPELRYTLVAGVGMRASASFEAMVRGMLDHALALAGDKGAAALQKVGDGRPTAKLTLGQSVDLLKSLDRDRLLGSHRRIISKADADVLSVVVNLRNRTVHDPSTFGDPDTITALLGALTYMLDTELISGSFGGA